MFLFNEESYKNVILIQDKYASIQIYYLHKLIKQQLVLLLLLQSQFEIRKKLEKSFITAGLIENHSTRDPLKIELFREFHSDPDRAFRVAHRCQSQTTRRIEGNLKIDEKVVSLLFLRIFPRFGIK